MRELILLILLLTMFGAGLTYFFKFTAECDARGGAVVQGVIGLACVAGPSRP